MNSTNSNTKFSIGDWVAWYGSADPWNRRLYRGQIVELPADGTLIVVDDEHHARSRVAARKAIRTTPEG